MEGVIISAVTSLIGYLNINNMKNVVQGKAHNSVEQERLHASIEEIKKESIFAKLTNANKNSSAGASSFDRISSILYIVLWVLMGALSAYLSWQSNSLIGWEIGYKAFFSFGSFLFPFYYLMMHFIAKNDMIHYIKIHM